MIRAFCQKVSSVLVRSIPVGDTGGRRIRVVVVASVPVGGSPVVTSPVPGLVKAVVIVVAVATVATMIPMTTVIPVTPMVPVPPVVAVATVISMVPVPAVVSMMPPAVSPTVAGMSATMPTTVSAGVGRGGPGRHTSKSSDQQQHPQRVFRVHEIPFRGGFKRLEWFWPVHSKSPRPTGISAKESRECYRALPTFFCRHFADGPESP